MYNMILGCMTSLECKNLSKQIQNVDNAKWEEVTGDVCHTGIRAKFKQNQFAMDTLVHRTRNKRIVECATDRLWATGISLNDPLSLDDTKWITPGILGQILESIWDEHAINQANMHHYYSQVPSMTHPSVTQFPSRVVQTIPRTVTSAPQMIPGAVSDNLHTTVTEGISSVSDSTSTSASTTPVSDMTATDTDPGDTVPSSVPSSVPETSNKPWTEHCEDQEDSMMMDTTNSTTNTKSVLI